VTDTVEPIERVTVLTGHTSPETAYVVDDYPYGSLRCTIRFWIETGTKGTAKGQQRIARQTTNPKREGEVWNKPHVSTYSEIKVLYLDGIGHVQTWGVGFHMSPEDDARARLMGIYDQLTEADRARYDVLLKISHRYAPQWERWETTVAALSEHMRATGLDPEVTNGVWKHEHEGTPHYLSDVAVYVTAARAALTATNQEG
jgi:hypothetical protein